jgi:putative PIN family toxin of toxin-antitoxin system
VKVVLDTNVLISGIFFSGPPAEILSYWRHKAFESVVSEPIIVEYIRVAEEIAKKFPRLEITEILEIFILNSTVVDTTGLKIRLCEDPDDNKFLECAVAGGCEVIVSGDKHLLKIKEFQGIKILKPRDFLENYL